MLSPPVTMDPFPTFVQVLGNTQLLSEELMAYEIGYRVQETERFFWDLAIFYNNYDRISTPVPGNPFFLPGPVIVVPGLIENAVAGITYGAELATTYRISDRWRLQSAYTLLFMDLHGPDGLNGDTLQEGSSPRNQYSLQSWWDLGSRCEFNLIGRYVDSLPALGVPKYIVADARFDWRARKNLVLSVVGRNLLNGAHPEFGNDNSFGTLRTEVQPEVYGQVTWRY